MVSAKGDKADINRCPNCKGIVSGKNLDGSKKDVGEGSHIYAIRREKVSYIDEDNAAENGGKRCDLSQEIGVKVLVREFHRNSVLENECRVNITHIINQGELFVLVVENATLRFNS